MLCGGFVWLWLSLVCPDMFPRRSATLLSTYEIGNLGVLGQGVLANGHFVICNFYTSVAALDESREIFSYCSA